MKRIFLVGLLLLALLLLVGACDEDEDTVREINTFMFGSDRSDAVRPEPAQTAAAKEPKCQRDVQGLIVECE